MVDKLKDYDEDVFYEEEYLEEAFENADETEIAEKNPFEEDTEDSKAGVSDVQIDLEANSVRFECDICSKSYSQFASLKKHILRHNSEKFHCHLCPKVFAKRSYFELHLKNQHNIVDTDQEGARRVGLANEGSQGDRKADQMRRSKFTCSICNKVCSSQCGLTKHRRTAHHANKSQSDYKKCPYCPRQFSAALRGNFFRHIETIHRDRMKANESPTNESDSHDKIASHTQDRLNESSRIFMGCDECNEAFSDAIDLYEHSKVHSAPEENIETIEGYNLSCDLCEQRLHTAEAYELHMREQHRQQFSEIKRFKCLWCGARARTRQGLYRHIRCNHDQRDQTMYRKRHRQKQQDEKPKQSWLCTICGKTSSTKFQADIHSRVHSGERPVSQKISFKQFLWSPNQLSYLSFIPVYLYALPKGIQISDFIGHPHANPHTVSAT